MSRSLIVSAAALLLASGVRAAVCGEVPRDDGRGLANLALRPGVKVEASSVYDDGREPMHQVRHLNDGRYGNPHSWIARENPAWVQVDLGEAFALCRIAFGRDNTGALDDRSAKRLEVFLAEKKDPATGEPKWQKVLDYDGKAVSRRTEFPFCPRAARWLRLALHTSNVNPVGIDELEIYGSTSQEILQWVRATATPPATFSQKDRPADLREAAVPLPRNFPPFDPRPSRPPAGPNAICLNGSDWRLELVEEGHRGLRHMIENDGKRWMACTVPGSVQSALLERGQISLPDGQVPLPDYFGTNSLHLTTATVYESWFKKSFRVPDDWKGRWVRLWLGAVDYRARFYLNGQSLGEHEGHFEPVTLDASAAIRPGAENLLTVQIAPFPRNRTLCARSQILKNLQSDCTPAASPLGISDDVFLLASDTLAVDDLCVRPALADDFGRASVALRLTVTSRADCDVEIISTIRSLQEPRQTYTGRQAARVSKGASTLLQTVVAERPALWWPNGAGPQNLYEARVTIKAADGQLLDASSATFGIRKLEMVHNEGAEGQRFPWTFVINGRKIFAKGASWVPSDCYYRNDAAGYERLLLHAKAAHFNILRWWGGGVPERESFYDLCDRLGIMLFHDFFLANGDFNDPSFLALLEPQARAFVRRLRNHPSIVLWTGGNEFAECAATHLLGKVAAEEDPTRSYRPPSPTAGEHHGPYNYNPSTHYAQCNANLWPHFAQVRSEFACCAAANANTLRKIIPAGELAGFAEGNFSSISWTHHNSHVWMDHGTTYGLFGPIADLDSYCAASQFARADGLRYAIEALRRQQFRTSGSIYWQFNETWPNAAGNASVDWFAQPRLTHDFVKKAQEPIHVCLKYDKIVWSPGETFHAELWAVSDRFEDLRGCEVGWQIYDAQGRRVAGGSKKTALTANRAAKIDDVSWPIPKDCDSFFLVAVSVKDAASGATWSENEYVYTAHHTTKHPLSVLLTAPKTTLRLDIRPRGTNAADATVTNAGQAAAVVCTLSLPFPPGAIVLFGDNGFCLPPGARRTVSVQATNPSVPEWSPDFAGLSVKAWNGR